MYTGKKQKYMEEDKEKANQVSFIEFMLLLCLLAYELNKNKGKERGPQIVKTTEETVEEFVINFMEENGMIVQEVPPLDKDLRGLAIPEDILLGGIV